MTINTRKHTSSIRRYMFTVTAAAFVLTIVAVNASFAQSPSTDRDNPTQLTANEIKGDGVDEKTQYFYSFTGGPGDVTITLDVKAEKSTAVSSVDIALFNPQAKKLLSTYSNPDHGSSKRAVETVNVHGNQTLLLEVEVSTGVASFKIKLDGAVTTQPSGTGPADDAAGTPQPGPALAAISADSSSPAEVMSTDQNNPTPLGTQVIKGASVDQKTKYFCTFMAVPGKVTLKLNVKSKKEAAVSSVDLELLDGDSKLLVSGFANPSLGDSKQAILSAKLDSKQKVVLTVTVSTGVDNYSLVIAGGVFITEAASLQPVIDLRPITTVAETKTTRSQSQERR